MAAQTRYALSGEHHIAYQVFGDGPIDLVYVPAWISQIEHYWDHPRVARYFRRLAAFSLFLLPFFVWLTRRVGEERKRIT